MKRGKPNAVIVFGLFSIGLGLAELIAGRRISRALGLEHRVGLIRVFGVREILTGIGLLTNKASRPWLFARVGGDVFDIALASSAMSPRNRSRQRAAALVAGLSGITLLDLATGVSSE